MRIAQVAPLYESVPPKLYGGTERVVSYLTEELVAQGHDVTLFASGDSVTKAKLVASSPHALRLAQHISDPLAYHFVQLEQVFAQAESFDVIHFHNDYLHYPLSRRHNTPHLTTLHGRLDTPGLAQLYEIFADIPIVSISNAQRKPLSWANWQRTVYHGLPTGLYTARQEHGSYLAFLGRICPEKRLDRAIQIARKFGMKLKVAAKVDGADQHYYDEVIEPLLNESCVEFIGEVDEDGKQEFLSNAYALLLPIDWPEPFGLVIIEAMACGTPVIAYRHGSIPELIEEGVTGFIVENIEEAVQALQKILNVDRRLCRVSFEERFTAARMAQDYVEVYQRSIRASDVVPGDGTESVRRALHRPNVLNAAVRNGRA
jgi:glycosyltransferase involved in cell wall biosynthesis